MSDLTDVKFIATILGGVGSLTAVWATLNNRSRKNEIRVTAVEQENAKLRDRVDTQGKALHDQGSQISSLNTQLVSTIDAINAEFRSQEKIMETKFQSQEKLMTMGFKQINDNIGKLTITMDKSK